jgi:hypothetical protein
MEYRTRMLVIAAAAALSAAVPASAQMTGSTKVRVVAKSAKIMATTALASDVVEEVPQGTEMDVLLEDDGWYWVILPRDGYGTRHGGWVRVKEVDGTLEAEAAAKAAQIAAKHEAEAAKKQAAIDKRAAEKAAHAAQAEQKAAAKEAERAAKAEQEAAKHAAKTEQAAKTEPPAKHAKTDAQQTTHADATSANGADDKRLQKAQKDLEKARADYDAALKRRADESTTPAAAPQR